MRNKGFTLVELLVVIAIIALLLSILMPSRAKVRDQGKRVVCQSNLKRQGMAFALYTQDNQDCYPSVYYYKPSNASNDAQNCYLTYWSWGGNAGTQVQVTNRLLNPYIF
jgi:prepilin-type N-terminal cleavage/methylation domain-containing protein